MSILTRSELEALAVQLHTITNLKYGSAGHLVYKDGKKTRPTDYDNTPIHDRTNTLKAQIDGQLLILDADGTDLKDLALIYPSTLNTFTTQTTANNKRHFYFRMPPNVKRTRKNITTDTGTYDILTQGIIFEGHSLDGQAAPFNIVNDSPMAELTEPEVTLINSLVGHNPLHQHTEHTYFVDKEVAKHLETVIKAETFGSTEKTSTLSRKDHNYLIRALMTSEFREEHKSTKKRIAYPTLNYTDFNTLAYKLAYNAAVPTEHRDSFLRLVLHDIYGVNPDSSKSTTILETMILAGLPSHGVLLATELVDEAFDKRLAPTVYEGYGVIKYLDSEYIKYAEISTATYLPRLTGKDGSFELSAAALGELRQLDKEDFKLIPQVKLLNSPFSPRVYFDVENNMDVLNTSLNSVFYNKAVPVDNLPPSTLTRLMDSYLGQYKDLYMHWMAHTLFGDRPPQTVLALVSPPKIPGGTGKSSLAQALLTRLVYASHTVSLEGSAAWGNSVYGKRVVIFNDANKLADGKWAEVYSFIRDRTTGGARRQDNMKYGSHVTSENTVAFTYSANDIPSVQDHDRRFLVILPQQIYGAQEPGPNAKNSNFLSKDDATQISLWFEHTKLDEPIDEIQQLANYLLYLYKEEKHKYFQELYNKAPETLGLRMAIQSTHTYSESIPLAIGDGPDMLETLIGEDDTQNIMSFIVMQTEGNTTYLPWKFLAKLLHRVNPTHEEKTSVSKLANAMKLENEDFKPRGELHLKFKSEEERNNYNLPDEYKKYAKAMLAVQLKLGKPEEYKARLLTQINNKPEEIKL